MKRKKLVVMENHGCVACTIPNTQNGLAFLDETQVKDAHNTCFGSQAIAIE